MAQFYVDGVLLGTSTGASYQCSWNTLLVSNGRHTITAVAVDNLGLSTSASLGVKVANT